MFSSLIENGRLEPPIKRKLERLAAQLSSFDTVAIAFSGGVDSSLLCVLAHQILGDRMVAMTIDSVINCIEDVPLTVSIAERFGFKHSIYTIDDLKQENFRWNQPDRCYHCKRHRFKRLINEAKKLGLSNLLEGSNADDLGDYRPGLKAVAELCIVSPLAEHGFDKSDIRMLAKLAGLENWDRPSQPCVATRIPYGDTIDMEKIEKVNKAEKYLVDNGFDPVRVRLYQDMARLEIMPDKFPRLISNRETIIAYLNTIGITYVTLDLSGFRSGSMNEGLHL